MIIRQVGKHGDFSDKGISLLYCSGNKKTTEEYISGEAHRYYSIWLQHVDKAERWTSRKG